MRRDAKISRFVRQIVVSALAFFLASCATTDRSTAARDASRYSHRMHNRFYEAWIPPRSLAGRRGKVSVPVDIAIDPNGRVRRFVLAKSSGYPALDASIRDVSRRVTRVARPPGTPAGGEFHLRIFFELDVKR